MWAPHHRVARLCRVGQRSGPSLRLPSARQRATALLHSRTACGRMCIAAQSVVRPRVGHGLHRMLRAIKAAAPAWSPSTAASIRPTTPPHPRRRAGRRPRSSGARARRPRSNSSRPGSRRRIGVGGGHLAAVPGLACREAGRWSSPRDRPPIRRPRRLAGRLGTDRALGRLQVLRPGPGGDRAVLARLPAPLHLLRPARLLGQVAAPRPGASWPTRSSGCTAPTGSTSSRSPTRTRRRSRTVWRRFLEELAARACRSASSPRSAPPTSSATATSCRSTARRASSTS